MLTLRRPDSETRIELMPLIDVIFLILTFFIYAMVLMVQIDVMPVPMESYISGESAEPVPATSITIDLDGSIYVGQQAATIEQVPGMIDEVVAPQSPPISPDLRVEGSAASAALPCISTSAHPDLPPISRTRWTRTGMARWTFKSFAR